LKVWKYPITIILLLIVLAVFTFYIIFFGSAEISESNAEPALAFIEISIFDSYNENVKNSEDDDLYQDELHQLEEAEPEDEWDDPNYNIINLENDIITLQMDEADISRGYLVLVNHEHKFELPARLDLVNIANHRESNFRVLGQNYLLERSVVGKLDEMMYAFIAETGNTTVAVISAFRNHNAQQVVLDDLIRRMGRTEALRWAAIPGHSEHHTALAVDFGIYSGGTRSTFTGTGATAWFYRNSADFGFIRRYPENRFEITQVSYEPWHFRFVSLPHSIIIHQHNWVLEEYIERIRNYTFEEPFEFEHDGIVYEIYFIMDTEVPIPLNSEFTISGNNIDGFIVTVIRIEVDPDAIIDVYT